MSTQTARGSIPVGRYTLQAITLAAVAAAGIAIGHWVVPSDDSTSVQVTRVESAASANAATIHQQMEWQFALDAAAVAPSTIDEAAAHRQLEWQTALAGNTAPASNAAIQHRQLEWQAALDSATTPASDAAAQHRLLEWQTGLGVAESSAADAHRQLEWQTALDD